MKSIKISLEMAQRVKEFVAITQSCEYEILLNFPDEIIVA